MAPEPNPPVVIDVCMCTYNRQSVEKTIDSVANQVLPDGLSLRIVIADNSADASAKDQIGRIQGRLGVDLAYVHAPKNNISIARNACLDAATSEWVAFIDDDEFAEPDWLSNLYETAIRDGHDIVFGLVQSIYGDSAPRWAVDGDLFSTFPVDEGDDLKTGYTGNTLMRMSSDALSGRRFSLSRGQTGGEDTEFFFNAWRDGARLGKCRSAVVYEPVEPHRLSLKWLADRTYRAGVTFAKVIHGDKENVGKARLLVSSATKASVSGLLEALNIFSDGKRAEWRIRRAFNCGVFSGALGGAEQEIYQDTSR